jgi:hypothetical protein
MDQLNHHDLRTLTALKQGPCVSIFTHTRRGGGADDRPRWREQLHESLRQLDQRGVAQETIHAVLGPALNQLTKDKDEFWTHASDGLAAFFAPGFARFYRLPAPFADRVVVGPRFHVTPLLGYVGDDGRFFTLALSRNQVRLLEGTAHSWRRIEVHGMPASLAEARPAHDRDEPLNYHTHRGGLGVRMQAVYHGQGVGIDDRKKEFLTYCQAIDRAIHSILGEGHAPLVLATAKHHAAIYRQANRYDHLLADIVRGNPDRTSDAELHERAWALVAPQFHARAELAAARYHQLAGTGRSTRQFEEILPAARRGELETLLVATGREIPGRFDAKTDRAEELSLYAPDAEDLVNVAASYFLDRGRNVFVVEPAALDGAAMAGVYFTPMNKHGK